MYKTSRSFYRSYTQYERDFFNARDVFMCVKLKTTLTSGGNLNKRRVILGTRAITTVARFMPNSEATFL